MAEFGESFSNVNGIIIVDNISTSGSSSSGGGGGGCSGIGYDNEETCCFFATCLVFVPALGF